MILKQEERPIKMSIKETLYKVEKLAEKAGATGTSVALVKQKNNRIDLRDAKVEKVKSGQGQQLSLQVYIDGKFSRHSTNRLDEQSLNDFVQAAVESTKFMQADEFRKLPDSSLYPAEAKDFGNYDESADVLSADDQLKWAMDAFQADERDDRIISTQSSFNLLKYEQCRLNSNGFYGESKSTYFTQSVNITLKAEADKRAEESAYATTPRLKELPTAKELFSDAYKKAEAKIGERKIESDTYDLIVENRVASKFISILLSAMAASALAQKRTFLDGKVGQQITAPHFSLLDDPEIYGAHGSFWFDDEGIAPKKRNLISNGIFKTHLVDNYYGRKLQMPVNGFSTGNLIFSGKEEPVQQMVDTASKAIWVNAFNGGNSNPATGDFSFGISGSFIKDGAHKMPISEMVITGNILDLFSNLRSIGDDPYPFAAMKRPTLYFENVYCSGL